MTFPKKKLWASKDDVFLEKLEKKYSKWKKSLETVKNHEERRL